jgi:hypothetical protein
MLGLGIGATATYPKLFSPYDINQLSLWLAKGIGNTAAQWDDSSGNGNHAAQGTSGNQAVPVAGDGLNFEGGSNHYYDLTSKITISTAHNFILAVVVTIESYDSLNCVLSDGVSEFMEFQTNKKIRIKAIDGGSSTTSVLTESATEFAAGAKVLIVISRNDGSTGTLTAYKNGELLEGSWSNQENPRAIEFANLGIRNDNDRPFDGIIHELLVYDFGTRTHTATDLADLHTYLTKRHGL